MQSYRSPLVFVAAIFLVVFGASYAYLQLTSGVPAQVLPLTPPPGLPPLASALKPSLGADDPSWVSTTEKPMDSFDAKHAPDIAPPPASADSAAPAETQPSPEFDSTTDPAELPPLTSPPPAAADPPPPARIVTPTVPPPRLHR